MGVLDLPFLYDLESRMRIIQEEEFARLSASENQWWSPLTKVQPSGSRKEFFFWILSTANISSQGYGGNIEFDDMTILESDYTALDAGKGLVMRKNQLSDLDGNGVQIAEAWTRQITAQAAYWPQKQVANLIVNGETGTAYDGQNFFSGAHPYNPKDPNSATFSNILTSTSSGIYPGACPIDPTNASTVDVAFNNIGKVIAYIKSLLMPDGVTPRMLIPKFILAPPALQTRVVQLCDAKYIAQAAASGGGSGDVEAVIKRWGLNTPLIAPELGSSVTGTAADDTTYYVGCEEMTTSQLGALLYVDREPFKITYYTGDGGGTGVDAILDRSRTLEWHVHGRNVAGYGHPFALFKCKAT